MSLCYDFQKWTMLTLGLVAISLSVGLLMQYAHGQGFDVGEMKTIVAYCFLHADSENPIQDLVNQNLVDPYFLNFNCGDIRDLLQKEETRQAQIQEQKEYDCTYGNLTPSEESQCIDTDFTRDGPTCLFSENEKDWSLWYTEDAWNSGYNKLTPEEISECKSAGYCGDGSVLHGCKDDKKEDKDNKE